MLKYITLSHGVWTISAKIPPANWEDRGIAYFDPTAVTCINDIEYTLNGVTGCVIHILGRKEPLVVRESRVDVVELIWPTTC